MITSKNIIKKPCLKLLTSRNQGLWNSNDDIDNDLTKPINLNKHPKFYDDVYLKIEEDLLKFPNYNFKHINLENIISNEVASSIIDFMKDKTYQDL